MERTKLARVYPYDGARTLVIIFLHQQKGEKLKELKAALLEKIFA